MSRTLAITSVLLALVLLALSTPASAALPPLELAQARLAQVRSSSSAAKSPELELRVGRVESGGVRDFRGAVKLGAGEESQLHGRGEQRLVLSPTAADPGARLLWIALSSPDPAAELQKLGPLRGDEAVVEVDAERFVYRYGTSPALTLSRTLDQLVALSARVDAVVWEARLSYGEEGALERVVVTRGGAPYLTARLSGRADRHDLSGPGEEPEPS